MDINCKTSCGLIRDGSFTIRKIGFDSNPRLHDLKLLSVLELFHFAFYFFLRRTDTVVISPPSLLSAPPPPQMGLKYISSSGGLNRGFTVRSNH